MISSRAWRCVIVATRVLEIPLLSAAEIFDFTTVQDRLAWSAAKWEKYRGRDVLPLWIADLDFALAPPIRRALAEQALRGDFGYGTVPRDLPGLLVDDHRRRYGWEIDPSWIVWLPGLVLGLNLAVKACCGPDEAALTLAPVYPPFLGAPGLQGRRAIVVPLREVTASGDVIRIAHEIDFSALEAALVADGRPRLLLLCHPHNPIGRAFRADELDRLADICRRHALMICADEVHCDLDLESAGGHLPFARHLAEHHPDLLARSITLHGPGKTYNIAGLGVAWAIISDAALRRRFRSAMQRLVPEVGVSAFVALRAALSESESWRLALLEQLRRNRDKVSATLRTLGLPHTHPATSFLTWIDTRALAARVGSPVAYFEQHGLGLSDGADFGAPGYVRLNFGLPPAQLDAALDRLCRAMRASSQVP